MTIYPAEIERVLQSHAGVREAAVVGISDEARGQMVIAFVAGDDVPGRDELMLYCKSQLAPYKVPEDFRALDELPKRNSGKVDKQALKGLAYGG